MTEQPDTDAPNEIMAVSREVKERAAAAAAKAKGKGLPLARIGLAAGIGSAAIAAAVLFASRDKTPK